MFCGFFDHDDEIFDHIGDVAGFKAEKLAINDWCWVELPKLLLLIIALLQFLSKLSSRWVWHELEARCRRHPL